MLAPVDRELRQLLEAAAQRAMDVDRECPGLVNRGVASRTAAIAHKLETRIARLLTEAEA